MKTRLRADGSRMVEGIDFENSYAPTNDIDSFRTIGVFAVQFNLWFYFFDAENSFQTNVIDNSTVQKYISLPPLYQTSFQLCWSNHPLHKKYDNWKELYMQTIGNMQGTKYAGHEWYKYLFQIFLYLSMVANTICKGVFV